MSKQITIISVLIFSMSFNVISQSYYWSWAKSAGGYNTDEIYGITTDITGNVYATGMFQSTQLDFDGITIYNAAGALGTADIFVVKYDPSGHALWARSCGGINNDLGKSIVADDYGNVYVTGNFSSDTLHFGDSLLANTITGLNEMMVLKYDVNGNEQWAFHATGIAYSEGISLSVDETGNGYVTGQFNGNTLLGDSMLSSHGIYDLFIARFSNAGKIIWAKSFGDYADDIPNSLCIDKWNNMYVSGTFNSDSIAFDSNTLYTAGGYDIFIAKLDSAGNVLWARREGDVGEDISNCVTTDKNGNLYITGGFESSSISFGATTFTNAGGFDIFIAKYDSSGLLQWAKNAGNNGYFDWGYNLKCNQSGVYVCGLFMSDTIFFDNIMLTNSGNTGTTEMFLVEYDFAGNILWALNALGNKTEEGACIALDANDNCYMGGTFASNALILGNTNVVNATTNGNADVFLAKLQSYGVGIKETLGSSTIRVFPNPADEYFYISGTTGLNANESVLTLFNSLGEIVICQQLQVKNNITRISCSNFTPGIYSLLLKTGNHFYRAKLIKK